MGTGQTEEQFVRGNDTYVKLVHECAAKDKSDPKFFRRELFYAVFSVSSALSLPNKPGQARPTAKHNYLYGMHGVGPLTAQLVIGISVRLRLLPVPLACHCRISKKNWSFLCTKFPGLKNVEYNKGADEVVKAIACGIGNPDNSNQGEEGVCSYILFLKAKYGKTADVSVAGIPNSWTVCTQHVQQVWVGTEPGSEDSVLVQQVVKFPKDMTPEKDFSTAPTTMTDQMFLPEDQLQMVNLCHWQNISMLLASLSLHWLMI